MAKSQTVGTVSNEHLFYKLGERYFYNVVLPSLEQPGIVEGLAALCFADDPETLAGCYGPDGRLSEELRQRTLHYIEEYARL